MKIRKALSSDIEQCLKIYNDQIEYEQQVGDLTAWRRDIYPDRALVEEAVELQDMYVIEEEDTLLACGRINHILEPHYRYISWQIEENDENKILVLHTLAVAQEAKRKGVGKMFLDFYEQQAHLQNCTTLRFDTVSSNNCYNESDVSGQHYFLSGGKWKKCYDVCDTCNATGIETDHQCDTCKTDFYPKEDDSYSDNCYSYLCN